jgi:hypothetical protein
MISIANPRAEKAARKLAKHLKTTISEAVAVACERVLHEHDEATRGRRRRQQLDRVLADIWKRHKLPSEAERARLADHRDLYGPDGLPR